MSNDVKSKENVDFGDYVKIEMLRHGAENEWYLYKVVSSFKSNTWIETPLKWNSEPISHDKIEEVLNVIQCGVDETKVIRVRRNDCKII